MAETMIMLNDNILVDPIENSDKTKGGLFIPKKDRGVSYKGRVLSMSDDFQYRDTVKKGDIVVFRKFGERQTEFGWIIPGKAVLGTLNE